MFTLTCTGFANQSVSKSFAVRIGRKPRGVPPRCGTNTHTRRTRPVRRCSSVTISVFLFSGAERRQTGDTAGAVSPESCVTQWWGGEGIRSSGLNHRRRR